MPFAGELAALATAICWASGANLFAAAAHRLGPTVLNRLRLAFGLLFLALALLVTRGSAWPVWATPFQLTILALSGLVGFVFGDGNGFRSILILGPGRATLVMSLAPLFTLLLAWPLLGERPGPLVLLGMALLLGGLAWVLLERAQERQERASGSVPAGILAGTLAALGQAGGYVLSKLALQTGIDPLSATVVRVGAAMLAMWAWAAMRGELGTTLAAARADRAGTAFTAGGAFAGPFLGVTLSLIALQYVEAGVAASITAFFPVLTILIAMRFHHERVTPRLILGAVISVAGVIVLFLR
ncbi:MAG: DMT family transporter [Candidatus Eisenbacteria bacterium]